MSAHRFTLGQSVALSHPLPDRTISGRFEVVRLLPATANGEPHYRVRGSDNVERAVGENQLQTTAGLS
ncbi:MAG: hypothetical protein JWR08_1565 [Enterovirga sp.]|jgi:hypothetical protein|nr:hypothetical protein [Enterovirga sp.]